MNDFYEDDDFVDFDPSSAFEEPNSKTVDEQVIENYQKDEKMMVLIFAQWCVNNDVDANELYKRAYPNQQANALLIDAYRQALEAGKSDEVTDITVFSVLEIFGNNELAFEVQSVVDQRK